MSSSVFDKDLLRTIETIAECGGFTLAAERLGTTQQVVSVKVKRAEASVGRLLFDRGGRVTLTGDGKAFVAYAREAAVIGERVARHFSGAAFAGKVRIGLNDAFAATHLPIVLAAVRASQPRLEIVTETGGTASLMARFDNGRLDLVLGVQRPDSGRGEALWREEMHWVGDPDLLDAGRGPLPIVTMPEPALSRDMLVRALTKAGIPFHVAFESEGYAGRHAAILAGLGLGITCTMLENATVPPPESFERLPTVGAVEFFLAVRPDDGSVVRDFAAVFRDVVRDLIVRFHEAGGSLPPSG